MISTVFPCLGAMAALFLTSVYPADLPPSCVQMCDKYRKPDSAVAFSLNCEDHQDDKDCMGNCKSCKDICSGDSPKTVYNCPGEGPKTKKADKSFDGNTESNNSALGIILWVVGILVVVIILVIIVVCYFKKRNKSGLLMGGVGVRPAFPVLEQQDDQSIEFEDPAAMSQLPSIPSAYQNHLQPAYTTSV